jgi:hypothetical protein
MSVSFADAGYGWAVSSNGNILCTTDGGVTWSAQASGTTALLYGVYFTDANNGWAVGNGGTILKYTIGTGSSNGTILFDVAPTVSVTGNTIALGTVTAGKNYSVDKTLASVQANCDWSLSLAYEPNFVRTSDGAAVPISNLIAKNAGSSDPYASLPTSISGMPTPTPTQLSYDMCLDVPWTIAPSPNQFVASTTLTVVPAP